jgi:5-methylcytosine-specific restriction endonuclease McrA
MDTKYRGYATHDLDEAIRAYIKKTGHQPTIIISRSQDNFPNHPLMVYDKSSIPNGVLISHEIIKAEYEMDRDIRLLRHTTFAIDNGNGGTNMSASEIQEALNKRSKPPKPIIHEDDTCPVCNHKLDFETLGHWIGWEFGITPPYWEILRLYIFRRDEFTCRKCHRRLAADLLQCHHIVRKEEGGTDSAKNLQTLCRDCHEDLKPIMPENDEIQAPDDIQAFSENTPK